MSGTTTAEQATRAASLTEEARSELRQALAARRMANGGVTFPARAADRIAKACTELQPVKGAGRTNPRHRLLLATGGTPRAVEELENVGELPPAAAAHFERGLMLTRKALKLRERALAERDAT
jgi:hypothetical protein